MSMDSNKFLGGRKGGYSKAQTCLQKILSIISSVPPHQQNSKTKSSFPHRHLLQLDSSSFSSSSQDMGQSFGNQGFLIDLNLELTSSPETDRNNSEAIEANSNQDKYEKEENLFGEKMNPVSETDFEDEKKGKEPFCRSGFGREEGSLALLNEAEEVSPASGDQMERGGLSSELGTRVIKGKESAKKGRECRLVDMYGRFDEVSRVVRRTNRGRRRVLPCRYKDSVLQPLARNARFKETTTFKGIKD